MKRLKIFVRTSATAHAVRCGKGARKLFTAREILKLIWCSSAKLRARMRTRRANRLSDVRGSFWQRLSKASEWSAKTFLSAISTAVVRREIVRRLWRKRIPADLFWQGKLPSSARKSLSWWEIRRWKICSTPKKESPRFAVNFKIITA